MVGTLFLMIFFFPTVKRIYPWIYPFHEISCNFCSSANTLNNSATEQFSSLLTTKFCQIAKHLEKIRLLINVKYFDTFMILIFLFPSVSC